ncbi:hypothetical protein H4R33_005252 [Dimargaris cristalligena]|uniref:Extracellular membrane protein CFEM domain-containing protein n=1 Tax=Dimargaris cristalligena TaxID=215637 RepID=A0A4P9ZU45_9FUNG|nr:hypothetical protein H4R33_005252 [Dimargaris cristalligena]RKP36371.1 hypothetical protein BJ085DRAFT_38039 [Dimargaris cristalligena]|eukprot:RKP36371.1 hypothetical protein BJ085DRAFT_38039 [Dimargaris cristalligena]
MQFSTLTVFVAALAAVAIARPQNDNNWNSQTEVLDCINNCKDKAGQDATNCFQSCFNQYTSVMAVSNSETTPPTATAAATKTTATGTNTASNKSHTGTGTETESETESPTSGVAGLSGFAVCLMAPVAVALLNKF